jgi:hypothetical protein
VASFAAVERSRGAPDATAGRSAAGLLDALLRQSRPPAREDRRRWTIGGVAARRLARVAAQVDGIPGQSFSEAGHTPSRWPDPSARFT